MKVRVIGSKQVWTADKIGKVYEVVQDVNFRYNRAYRVICNVDGSKRTISRKIYSDECEVVKRGYPVVYMDYVRMIDYERQEEEMYEKMANEYEEMRRSISCAELKEDW